ncbi:MAG: hypothetical protein JRN34_00195 [Nitrososphaerota archaeon]|nr:hypothetical protein [Nitrososphaerota archaeon]MDG6950947.1 hypothetical protein [Nitrososphaerota archaeon]
MALLDKGAVGRPFWLSLLHHLIIRPLTPTELALLEHKHLSSVSRELGRLRREGLVECTEVVSRQKFYKPTQEGYILAYASLRQGR